MVSGACSKTFLANFGDFLKHLGQKEVGVRPPPLDLRLKEIETQTRSDRYCCHEPRSKIIKKSVILF